MYALHVNGYFAPIQNQNINCLTRMNAEPGG